MRVAVYWCGLLFYRLSIGIQFSLNTMMMCWWSWSPLWILPDLYVNTMNNVPSTKWNAPSSALKFNPKLFFSEYLFPWKYWFATRSWTDNSDPMMLRKECLFCFFCTNIIANNSPTRIFRIQLAFRKLVNFYDYYFKIPSFDFAWQGMQNKNKAPCA